MQQESMWTFCDLQDLALEVLVLNFHWEQVGLVWDSASMALLDTYNHFNSLGEDE
jgi:hypothetical protein